MDISELFSRGQSRRRCSSSPLLWRTRWHFGCRPLRRRGLEIDANTPLFKAIGSRPPIVALEFSVHHASDRPGGPAEGSLERTKRGTKSCGITRQVRKPYPLGSALSAGKSSPQNYIVPRNHIDKSRDRRTGELIALHLLVVRAEKRRAGDKRRGSARTYPAEGTNWHQKCRTKQGADHETRRQPGNIQQTEDATSGIPQNSLRRRSWRQISVAIEESSLLANGDVFCNRYIVIIASIYSNGSSYAVFRRGYRYLDSYWPASSAGLRTAAMSRPRLYLDSRLLGIRSRRRILLGSRHVGTGPRTRPAMDTRLLGLEQRTLFLACGILGPACRVLWRSQLRLRLHRSRLRGRILEGRGFLL